MLHIYHTYKNIIKTLEHFDILVVWKIKTEKRAFFQSHKVVPNLHIDRFQIS